MSVLLSGGQAEKGAGNNPTEADVMFKYLVQAGVPQAKMCLEKESLTTVQNMEKSKPILVRHRFSKVYLVTTDFHLDRSLLIFKNLIPAYKDKVEGFPTPNGMPPGELNRELSVEAEMIGKYKTRFPKWDFNM